VVFKFRWTYWNYGEWIIDNLHKCIQVQLKTRTRSLAKKQSSKSSPLRILSKAIIAMVKIEHQQNQKFLFMKMHKNVYLALAILLLISFIDSLFYTERTHKLLFWEVNIWVYRLFRLGIAIVFMKSYLDIRSAKKLKEK
jgi:hypothetical protein